MENNNIAPLIKIKAEENKLSKRLDAVLDKYNETLELMKKNTINSTIPSIGVCKINCVTQ